MTKKGSRDDREDGWVDKEVDWNYKEYMQKSLRFGGITEKEGSNDRKKVKTN